MSLLTKSKYMNGLQCRRLLWFADRKQLPEISLSDEHKFSQGHEFEEYVKKTPSFSVKQRIINLVDWYQRDAERLISTLLLRSNPEKSYLYIQVEPLKELAIRIKGHNDELAKRDVTGEDIILLSEIIKHVEEINGIESALITRGICPRCGNNITSTSKYSGGGYDEPPDTVAYFVGCEECGYELHSETVNI